MQLGDPAIFILNYEKNGIYNYQKLQINYNEIDGKIVDISCGKYHTLILTDKGYTYAFGNNRFGQLGMNNNLSVLSKNPVRINIKNDENKDILIKQIKSGDLHNVFLSESGDVYTNGDNSLGQLNGEVDSSILYKSTPEKISLNSNLNKVNQNENFLENDEISKNNDGKFDINQLKHNFNLNDEKFCKIKAKNYKTAIFSANSKNVYHWGGYYYLPYMSPMNLPLFDGINNFAEENLIKEKLSDSKINDVGLGLYHDLVLL